MSVGAEREGQSRTAQGLPPEPGRAQYLRTMADGTLKQVSPFTGTQVWTVPGRADRPLGVVSADPKPIGAAAYTSTCAFCSERYLQTPPEKSRVVRRRDGWRTRDGLSAREAVGEVAELRRIPNLYEILPLDYWRANYGYRLTEDAEQRMRDYLADPHGYAHVLQLLKTKIPADRRTGVSDAELVQHEAAAFFGGTHDVIVARRHFRDGATDDSQLASSGSLSVEEHRQYTAFSVDSMRSLYESNPYARYVAVFQNWLKPAGASFDHLHKQLVAIDEYGVQTELELARTRERPNIYNEAAVHYAQQHGLVIAASDHAVAFAGFGHRYPTLEVYSRSEQCDPWRHSDDEVAAMSDLLHAMHAASGADIPCNEEWHHKPPTADAAMPWRVMIKWRVSTLAGFEGGTKIYLNTITPTALRDRLVPRLRELRDEGLVASDIRIADECDLPANPLRYRLGQATGR